MFINWSLYTSWANIEIGWFSLHIIEMNCRCISFSLLNLFDVFFYHIHYFWFSKQILFIIQINLFMGCLFSATVSSSFYFMINKHIYVARCIVLLVSLVINFFWTIAFLFRIMNKPKRFNLTNIQIIFPSLGLKSVVSFRSFMFIIIQIFTIITGWMIIVIVLNQFIFNMLWIIYFFTLLYGFYHHFFHKRFISR
jgi:hypothetical protein